MHVSTLQDVQYALVMHETRLEQQNTFSQISSSNSSANIAYNNNNRSNRSTPNERGTYRGRGGRRRGGKNNRLYCQLCQHQGHDALRCHKRFDIYFHGNTNNSSNHQRYSSNQGSRSNSTQISNNNLNANNQNNYSTPPRYQSYISQSPTKNSTPETTNDSVWFINSRATNHVTSYLNNLSISNDYN